MSALALQAVKGDVKGTFLVNSAPRQTSSYARACVLVQQDDIFFSGVKCRYECMLHKMTRCGMQQ